MSNLGEESVSSRIAERPPCRRGFFFLLLVGWWLLDCEAGIVRRSVSYRESLLRHP